MPCAIPLAVREQIILLHLQQHTFSSICLQVPASFSTVRRLLRNYKADPGMDLKPRYNHCGQRQSSCDAKVLRAALWLKRLHLGWGAPLIHLLLKERYGTEHLPSVRTLQQWYLKKGLNPPREHRPSSHIGWAVSPHNIWQVDAKERLTLLDGTHACYLSIIDEHSGAGLSAPVFPPQPH